MHEKSLVRSLLRLVNDIMTEHGATKVETVTVDIGPLSGVEPLLVQEAFAELSAASDVGNPMLKIQEIKLTIRCRDCGHESSSAGLIFQCAACDSPRVQIIRGDEFRLIDVSLQVPMEPENTVS